MRAPKCNMCDSVSIDRRTFEFIADGEKATAERWKCADCGAVAWLWCNEPVWVTRRIAAVGDSY
jgi:hypothetical protein